MLEIERTREKFGGIGRGRMKPMNRIIWAPFPPPPHSTAADFLEQIWAPSSISQLLLLDQETPPTTTRRDPDERTRMTLLSHHHQSHSADQHIVHNNTKPNPRKVRVSLLVVPLVGVSVMHWHNRLWREWRHQQSGPFVGREDELREEHEVDRLL